MVLSALLGVVVGVLAVGGVAKLRDPQATTPMLQALGLPGSPHAARLLGAVEVGVGVATFLLGGRVLAAAVALLFLGFTVAVLRLRAADGAVSCGCFGRSSAPPTLIHAAVDLAAAAIAGAATIAASVGFLDLRPELPAAGVPELLLTVLAVWLGVAVLTVLPEALVAARRTPASDGPTRPVRTFTLESSHP